MGTKTFSIKTFADNDIQYYVGISILNSSYDQKFVAGFTKQAFQRYIKHINIMIYVPKPEFANYITKVWRMPVSAKDISIIGVFDTKSDFDNDDGTHIIIS